MGSQLYSSVLKAGHRVTDSGPRCVARYIKTVLCVAWRTALYVTSRTFTDVTTTRHKPATADRWTPLAGRKLPFAYNRLTPAARDAITITSRATSDSRQTNRVQPRRNGGESETPDATATEEAGWRRSITMGWKTGIHEWILPLPPHPTGSWSPRAWHVVTWLLPPPPGVKLGGEELGKEGTFSLILRTRFYYSVTKHGFIHRLQCYSSFDYRGLR